MILRLTAQTAEDLAVLGGKGCGLVRLLRAGLPVPEAFCIPVSASLGADADSLTDELNNLWELLSAADESPPLLAVRSSAVAEDLEGASFAGVYRTILGVSGREELLAAVKDCWAAFHEGRALVYRDGKGIGHEGGIAVVIQRMLRPEVSGVLLTANPRRPFAREIALDASWGLGEAVVSGKTHPDHWVIERGSRKIREEHLGPKEVEIVWDGGIRERAVDEARRAKACLSADQLEELAALAAKVEAKIGPRQDLEWAIESGKLYVLQQRPMTGLPPERPANIWTRKFGDEYLADYSMPLSRDLLVKWISDDYLREMARLQGRKDLENLEPLRNFHGYSYLSGAYIGKMLEAAPKAQRAQGVFDWFPPSWNQRIAETPWQPRYALSMMAAPLRDPRGPIGKNPRALAAHCENIARLIVPKLSQDYAALSKARWREQFEEVYELGREHFRVIRWGMGFYNPLLHGLLQGALRAWAGDRDGDIYQAVISGLPGTKTAEINREIWNLGISARQDAAVLEALRGRDGYEKARRDTSGASFWKDFDAFLARHGHRAATREVAQPRWKETPEVIFGLVRAQAHSPEAPPDPAVAEERVSFRRKEAQEKALSRSARGPGGFLRRQALAWILETTQTYTAYRENQRYYLDYLLFHIRTLVLDQGRRLAEAGAIGAPWDIFLLSSTEFRELIERPRPSAELSERIEERRRDYLRWKDRLPATFLYDDVETEGEIAEGDPQPGVPAKTGAGFGASKGRARGKARVVRDFSEIASVETGEILVANNIDPGWTSVFPLLSGLVTETGGILSHGAILAREYGVPAVTGVKNAVAEYSSGEFLEIDGATGHVGRSGS